MDGKRNLSLGFFASSSLNFSYRKRKEIPQLRRVCLSIIRIKKAAVLGPYKLVRLHLLDLPAALQGGKPWPEHCRTIATRAHNLQSVLLQVSKLLLL